MNPCPKCSGALRSLTDDSALLVCDACGEAFNDDLTLAQVIRCNFNAEDMADAYFD